MIETNNPGYLAAALYESDPASEMAPDPFHNESDRGSSSYILNQINLLNAGGGGGGGVTLGAGWGFVASTAGDPGNKKVAYNNALAASTTIVRFNNTTDNNVDASAVLLNLKAGDVVYLQDKQNSAQAHLFTVSGAPTDQTTYVDVPVTYNSGSGLEFDVADKVGAIFQGFGVAGGGLNGSGVVQTGAQSNAGGLNTTASGDQSLALGNASVVGEVDAQGFASLVLGQTSGTGQVIVDNDVGVAIGAAFGANSEIRASFYGGIARGFANAGGKILGTGSAAHAAGWSDDADSLIQASHAATNAFGFVANGGLIKASDEAAMALGYADGAGASVIAQGEASLAIGNVTAGQVCLVNGDGAMQLGPGTNSFSHTLQVGAAGTGIHLWPSVPAGPANGDIWTSGGSVLIRSAGVSVTIAAAAGGGLNQSGAGFTEGATGDNAGGRTTGTGTIVASGIASLAIGDSDDVTRNLLASAPGSVAMGSATGSVAIEATAIGAMQFGGGSNTVAHSAQFAGLLRLNFNAATIGFFGNTPTGQHTTDGETVGFTAGVGSAVLDDSTFTGNVGVTAYTIGDVVKAMKNLGFMGN